MNQTVKRVVAVAAATVFTTAAWAALTAGTAQADEVSGETGTRVTEDGLLDLDLLDYDHHHHHDCDDWDDDLIDIDIL